MNNPKIFYRELDALLAKIGKNISGKNFLSSIIIELEQSFGNELHIYDGSIYEKRDTEFVKIYSNGSNHWVNSLSADLPAIKEVLRHGSFIYDDPQLGAAYGVTESHEYIIPVAIFVHSPEQNWILAFSLKSGWMREEITLFLNAVRTALNYRLFSEIIGGELQQAVEIQKSLLPKTTPNFPGFQMYGKSIPAEQVGGDFYEYFDFEEGNFGISIGDVSGHGLPSALLVRDVVIVLRMGLSG
jgi:sigma-B regulation protein RsbU (phosphoserine phosphatase)